MADTPNSSNGLKRARSSSPVNGAGGNDNGNGGKKQNTGRDAGSPEEAGAVSESSSARRGGHDAAVMDSNNNAGEAAAAAAHSASGMPSGSDATAAAASAAPPITIRALIVTQDASIIIGKAGSHIKEIREKAGAKVSVTEAQQGNPERVLLVTGPLDAVSKAYGLIVRKINDEPYDQPSVPGSRAVTIKYLVPNNRMGSVIGKAGSKIKEIQEASGARLQASEGMLPGSTDRVLSVSGVADAIHIAVYYVGTILQETPDRVSATASTAYRPASTAYTPGAASAAGSYGAPASSRQPPGAYFPPGANVPYGGGAPAAYGAPAGGAFSPGGGLAGNQTQQLYIPNELVGNIIGKGGQKINEIRQMSNCSIKIMESTDSQGAGARGNERLVTITGQPHCIATAIQMLHQRLESEKAKKMQAGAY